MFQSIKWSFQMLVKPARTFTEILSFKDYRHHYFIWFYGIMYSLLGYARKPDHFLHNLADLPLSHLVPDIAKPASAILIEAFLIWLEIMLLAILPFILMKVIGKALSYDRILRVVAFSLPPALYGGAVWGLIANNRLRLVLESPGDPVSILWGLPYWLSHAALIYFIYLGFLTLYQTRYKLPAFMTAK